MQDRTVCIAIVAVSLVLRAGAVSAQVTTVRPFVSQEHFPGRTLVYFSVKNVARLKDGFAKTLLGRLITHSGTQRATADLRQRVLDEIENASREFTEVVGKSPLDLLGLLHGEVAFAVTGIGPWGFNAALAIELGRSSDELLEVVSGLQSAFEQVLGQPLATKKFGDHEATVWPLPGGQVFHTVLGGHLVVTLTPELLGDIVSMYVGGTGAGSWKENPAHAELQKALPVEAPEVRLEVDLAALRTLLLSGLAMTTVGEQLPAIVRLSGLEGLGSFGVAAGFLDDGLEGAWHLGMQRETGGVLKAIQQGFPAVEDVDAALAKVPSGAREFGACRVNVGRFLSDVDRLAREHMPWARRHLDELSGMAAENLGISSEDFFKLAEATFYGFSVEPPAGGYLADELILVRTREIDAYWNLARKSAEALGATSKRFRWSRGRLECLDFRSVFSWDDDLFDVLRSSDTGFLTALGLVGQSYLVRSDLNDGWTVISNAPQAVRRYVDIYSGQTSLAEKGELAVLARSRVKGASVASVGKGDSILRAYNTLVSVSTDYLGGLLAQVGVDPSQLPPGELFLEQAQPGFVRLEIGADGFTVHGHRPLTFARSYLVGVAAAGIAAGFMMPSLSSGREEAYKVQCANNLKTLYTFGMMYGDRHQRAFPHSPKGSVESFQLLIDYFPDDFVSRIFICSGGEESEAAFVNGKVALSPESCSYEMVSWQLKVTAREAIFIYDKAPHHGDGRNVVFTDGSVRFVDESEFQRCLEADRERFGRR